MVSIIINGNKVQVPKNYTVLKACKDNGIDIPTLCHDDRLEPHAACRLCIVEIKGMKNLATSCSTKVADGMEVFTNTKRVREARKEILNLMISNHPMECLTCEKSGECKLQDYCEELGIGEIKYKGETKNYPIDYSNPFYYNDQNKCISCGKCVKVCEELQCTSAISFSDRGFYTHVTHPFEKGMEHSDCVSCGNCVSVCPVGALMPKSKENLRLSTTKRVRTTCSYCGVGCQMDLRVKENKVVGVDPAFGPSNNGLLCVKGKFGYKFINHPDRLKTPLIKKDGKFKSATWDEAYEIITNKINEIKEKYGSDAFAGLSSARCTNEENYLMQKLFRAVIGTNNIDHCARLCHSSTVAGLATTLGSGAMTNSIGEILNADVIFVTGSNTTENHPVIGSQMRQALRKGAKLIVADPRKIDLAKDAEVFLQIKPGTNVALLNGMMNVILKEELYNKDYIESKTENFEEAVEVIRDFSVERAAEICGVNSEDIRKAARLYAKADRAGIFYAMGITQHSSGTHHVMAIANLAMMCGNIGKESAGVNPLRGQNNVQGACDMAALPGDFPGYQKVSEPEVLEKFERAWGVKLSDKPGLTIPKMMDGAALGYVKFMYIMGENPMVSDPNINHIREALQNLDFLLVQDIFFTETAELADVVLPAACFAEKDGTFTNTERRVQRVRKAVDAPGEAKADWLILIELMDRLGYKRGYNHPSEIMDEIASVTPQYGGISYDRIEETGLQWPCPTKDHPGTKYLHKGSFVRGKGLFMPISYEESAEKTDEKYPFVLTTGRIIYHYHTRTMTGRVEELNQMAPESYIEISPATADKIGVQDGEEVRVSSRRGIITTKAKVTDIIEDGVVFMPFHYAKGAANVLTNTELDPISNIPELKVCAVSIEKAV
jgi:formate dehydrogenase major subunit